jgi:hypothetical protein
MADHGQGGSSGRSWFGWALLALVVILAIAVFVYPAWWSGAH